MPHSEMLAARVPAARMSFVGRTCRRRLEARLLRLREGVIEIVDGDRMRRFGTPVEPALAARLEVRDRRTYRSLSLIHI